MAVFSFIGNYFWTHYFYQVLGASYTMQTWDLNQVPVTSDGTFRRRLNAWQVPICMYFITHAYFCLYHTLSNMLIRQV